MSTPPVTQTASSGASAELARAFEVLAASGLYRTLPYVQPPAYRTDFPVDHDIHDVVAFVDCEATDGDPRTAHPIEIGASKAVVVRATGEILAFTGKLSMLEDPGVPSEPGAQEAHGITAEELAGQRFDAEAVVAFLEGVDYIAAHNAGYDQPVLMRRMPVFGTLPWVCTMRDVDWSAKGCSSRALDYLLFKAGHVHKAHRALADVEALATLVAHDFGGDVPLVEMAAAARGATYHVLAIDAEFGAKDAMKDRDYGWNPGEAGDNKFPRKCWSSPALDSEDALDAEIAWLIENAYLPRNHARSSVLVVQLDATNRYILDAKAAALATALHVPLSAAIERARA